MSQHTIQDAAGRTHQYGFDHPLSQYFLDKEVGPLSRVYGNAVALMEALEKHGLWDKIPEAHRQAICLDLPF